MQSLYFTLSAKKNRPVRGQGDKVNKGPGANPGSRRSALGAFSRLGAHAEGENGWFSSMPIAFFKL
jgi:hypothetical protein